MSLSPVNSAFALALCQQKNPHIQFGMRGFFLTAPIHLKNSSTKIYLAQKLLFVNKEILFNQDTTLTAILTVI